jgi:hypothetical protein
MATMYSSEQEADVFYPKEEDGGVDYFEWYVFRCSYAFNDSPSFRCASFLTAPKEGYMSSASSCSSGPPSERSSPNVSPYSTPEQYHDKLLRPSKSRLHKFGDFDTRRYPPPPSPSDVPMAQYCYEPYQEEPSPRIVVPQVFQTINIGVVQQYPGHNHPSILSHSQGGFNVTQQARPLIHQIAHNQTESIRNSKELLVIDHSKEVQKRKALVMDVTPVYVIMASILLIQVLYLTHLSVVPMFQNLSSPNSTVMKSHASPSAPLSNSLNRSTATAMRCYA